MKQICVIGVGYVGLVTAACFADLGNRVVVTEWNEFKQLDLEKLKGLLACPMIYDGRNIYDPASMNEMGFAYRAIGRGMNGK